MFQILTYSQAAIDSFKTVLVSLETVRISVLSLSPQRQCIVGAGYADKMAPVFCRRKNPVIGKRLYLAMWTIAEDSQRSPIIILFEVIVINNDSDPIELLRLLTIFIPSLIYRLLFVDSTFFFGLSTVSFHFTHQKPFLQGFLI